MSIETLRPNAGGDETACYWYDGAFHSPDPLMNFQQVNESVKDEFDTCVANQTNIGWWRDLYNLANHSAGSGIINWIWVWACCYAVKDVNTNLKLVIKAGTGNGAPTDVQESSQKTIPAGYWTLLLHQFETNPATDLPFTWDEIDKLQAGISIRGGEQGVAGGTFVTQVYVEINYTILTEPVAVTEEEIYPYTDDTNVRLRGSVGDDGGEACEYRFKWWKQGGTVHYTTWTGSAETNDWFWENIYDLEYDTHYYFAAQVRNSGYTSDWGSTRDFWTAAPVVAPIVNTYSAQSVEETTATARGGVNDTGGENPNRYIDYDTNSGEPYAYTKDCGVGGTGYFYGYLTGLTKGEKYYFRARAVNSGGTGKGSELTFITKPDAPTSLSCEVIGPTQINLTWNKGTGAYYTYIRRKVGSYPTSITDGQQVYAGTGTDHNDTTCNPSTHYYYRAWSRAYDGGWGPYSDAYSSCNATTPSGEVVTPGSSRVKGTQFRYGGYDALERYFVGSLTGNHGTPGKSRVKGTKFVYIDNNGDERDIQGTLTGSTVTAGDIRIKGTQFRYGGYDTDQRYIEGSLV